MCLFFFAYSVIYAIARNNSDINEVVADTDTVGGLKP